ncbi:MAG: hypothetical protein ACI9TV_001539 [Sulfurimonas sp.]|jgi:hypothetical protein|uniref:hypothetical protein n=1 Tax=Sulfurimonas sp. TaxID=2022749 RepID=UPI0039E4CFC7
MLSETKKKLQAELNNYLEGKLEFEGYYPGMNVFPSPLYKEQLQEALEFIKKENEITESSFQLYLDTIIVNMHTKVKKYKKSIYFDNENVKDIQNQGFTIPFFVDEKKGIYLLLGIVKSEITV